MQVIATLQQMQISFEDRSFVNAEDNWCLPHKCGDVVLMRPESTRLEQRD